MFYLGGKKDKKTKQIVAFVKVKHKNDLIFLYTEAETASVCHLLNIV